MRRKTELPELLSPAGSEEALLAAVSAGADAVYLGGLHSARAHAKNFDEGGLLEAVRYAHLHGVKVYLALNTLLFDRELPALLSYADRVAAMGIDAAIVADLGVMRLLSRHLPGLALHASTQAFIHSTATADFYASRGASRVVLARELSRADIVSAVEGSRAEIEVFLHGALCVSHSGQCLFSSLVGGRSGNRGECAQPCRLPYGGDAYPLSLADLSLAAHIPSLIEDGVASLKIEGRMKSPAYVGGVTALYRRLLDEGRAATEEELRSAAALFSRGGFTDKYYTARHSLPMGGVRSEADKRETREAKKDCKVSFTKEPVFVTGSVSVREGAPASLSLTLRERTVTVTGATPSPARTAPLTEAELTSRISRLGGTGLALAEGGLSVRLDGGLFLTAAEQNDLRRRAVSALLGEERAPIGAVYRKSPTEGLGGPRRVALTYSATLAPMLRESDLFERVYLSLHAAAEAGFPTEGVILPSVIPDSEAEEVRGLLRAAAAQGVRYAIFESYGQLSLVREAGLSPVGGFRLGVTNRESVAELLSLGVSDITLSPELGAPRVRDLGGRILSYGRIPLMLTERCFVREGFGCGACGHASLTDRRGVSFPLLREHPHRTLVLNSLPTYLADRPDLLAEAGHPREAYLFTNETKKECAAVLAAARQGRPLAIPCRRLPQCL